MPETNKSKSKKTPKKSPDKLPQVSEGTSAPQLDNATSHQDIPLNRQHSFKTFVIKLSKRITRRRSQENKPDPQSNKLAILPLAQRILRKKKKVSRVSSSISKALRLSSDRNERVFHNVDTAVDDSLEDMEVTEPGKRRPAPKRSVSSTSRKEDRITLYEELRLVERPEKEINAAWKGAQLTLFFLTFVFGSFCTFCFHVLMYMFDEKCVLNPKMVLVKDVRRSNPTGIIIDYIAAKDFESMPLEFVTTIWVDKSHCYLPTYVPLLSGICGLIWTAMYLMSSSGSQTLSGLQRPWRTVPAVFIFSLIMSALCLYTTIVTQRGLTDMCQKLAEVFGSDTCSYTINIATLSYERRIRGIYQATRLTIAAAWLHTLCWIFGAILALARVLLVVDFRCVRVRAELMGNVERMLERHEKHIRTKEYMSKDSYNVVPTKESYQEPIKVHFVNKGFGTESDGKDLDLSKESVRFLVDSAVPGMESETSPKSTTPTAPTELSETPVDDSANIVEFLHEVIGRIRDVVYPTPSTPRSENNTEDLSVSIAEEINNTILEVESKIKLKTEQRTDTEDIIAPFDESVKTEKLNNQDTEVLSKSVSWEPVSDISKLPSKGSLLDSEEASKHSSVTSKVSSEHEPQQQTDTEIDLPHSDEHVETGVLKDLPSNESTKQDTEASPQTLSDMLVLNFGRDVLRGISQKSFIFESSDDKKAQFEKAVIHQLTQKGVLPEKVSHETTRDDGSTLAHTPPADDTPQPGPSQAYPSNETTGSGSSLVSKKEINKEKQD